MKENQAFNDDCYSKMLRIYDALPKRQRKITDFIVSNLNDVVFNSISELANKIGTSEATLVRYSRNLGYNGFAEFKQALFDYYKTYFSILGRINRTIQEIPKQQSTFAEMIQKEIELLMVTKESVNNDSFHIAVKELCKARTIFIIGNDLNVSVMDDLSLRLSRFRLRTIEASLSSRNLFEKLLFMSEKDVAIIFDFYRPSVDFTKLIEYINSKQVPVILITDSFVPPMMRSAKTFLYVKRDTHEMFNSQVVPMAISNALVIGVAEYLGEKALIALEELGNMKNTYNLNSLEEFSI